MHSSLSSERTSYDAPKAEQPIGGTPEHAIPPVRQLRTRPRSSGSPSSYSKLLPESPTYRIRPTHAGSGAPRSLPLRSRRLRWRSGVVQRIESEPPSTILSLLLPSCKPTTTHVAASSSVPVERPEEHPAAPPAESAQS